MFGVINNTDNICGGGICEEDGTVTYSNLAEHILKIDHNLTELETIDDVIKSIKRVITRSVFTSKYVNVDEFTNLSYNSDHLTSSIIAGCYTFVRQPAGIVLYHEHNQLLFDCLQIQYMINYRSIPNIYTNLDSSKLYVIPRGSGDDHNSIIKKSDSIYINSKSDNLIIKQYFNYDKSDPEMINGRFYELGYAKSVVLNIFLSKNNIENFSIHIPYINLDNYDSHLINDELATQLAEYYNNKIDEHLKMVRDCFIINNSNTTLLNGNELIIKNEFSEI
jgi:hypothetical protein